MAVLGAVHLARYANGVEPFRRFIDSYVAHPAGVDHDLVVVFKGFPGPVPPEYLDVLAPLPARTMELDDGGFDIGSYWAAAARLDHDVLCFLNSFSQILDDGWLAKLDEYLGADVGIVGASGSWWSHTTEVAAECRAGLALWPWQEARPPLPPQRMGLRDRAYLVRRFATTAVHYPPFPNVHLRTNCFLMRRRLMLELRVPPMGTKADAHRFESGYGGFTRQVLQRGVGLLVVGRDGVAYPPDQWPASRTYNCGDQENLLVADNQTEYFRSLPPGDQERRARHTWGVAGCHGAGAA